MNGRETAAAERALDNQRRAHLVDAEAVRRALLGDPVALTELERGATITVVDLQGLDRNLAARGLGVTEDHLDKLIRRRRTRAVLAYKNALASGMRGPALELVEAVRGRDVCAVAGVLESLSMQGQYALAIVLADMVAAGTPVDPIDSKDLP